MGSVDCNLKMIGYKIAKVGENGGIRVVVTLEIPSDAVTNIARNNIKNALYAKYRTNKAKVIYIEDENNKNYTRAQSFNYIEKSLEYVVNETIVIDDYDMNLENVCAPGVHFFLNRRCAELYGLEWYKNGFFQVWHDNGQIKSECSFVNGEIHGKYSAWYDNGRKLYEINYKYGVKDGIYYRWWYANDQLMEKIPYVNGVIHGHYEYWNMAGVKTQDLEYVNGKYIDYKKN